MNALVFAEIISRSSRIDVAEHRRGIDQRDAFDNGYPREWHSVHLAARRYVQRHERDLLGGRAIGAAGAFEGAVGRMRLRDLR